MSYGMTSVSRKNPCPICGHTDWCGYLPTTNYPGHIVICMRSKDNANVHGYDGKSYVFLGTSKTGNNVYEEYEQHLQRKEQWKIENGYTNHNKKKKIRFSAPTTYTSPSKNDDVLPNSVAPKAPDKLHPIYSRLQELLVLEDFHKEYLYSNGWTDEMINHYHVVSFPLEDNLRRRYHSFENYKNPFREEVAQSLISEFGSDCLLGVPGAFMQGNNWTFYGHSGILFPMYDQDGSLFRLRIRMDFRDTVYPIRTEWESGRYYYKDGENKYYVCMKGIYKKEPDGSETLMPSKGKYRTLASCIESKDNIRKNLLEKGCASKNEASLYMPPNANKQLWYITEGEPKGAFSAFKLGAPFYTIPGVNSYSLLLKPETIEHMRKNGMQGIAIAFDADKHQNQAVMKYEKMLIDGFKELGIKNLFTVEWDGTVGKGIDDLLANAGSIRYVLK